MNNASINLPRKSARIAEKLRDYHKAVRSARELHGLDMLSAVSSVIAAKMMHGMGPRFHALYGLASVPRRRWNDFLPASHLEAMLQQVNPKAAREVVNDKLRFHEHCRVKGISTIPIIAGPASSVEYSPDDYIRDWCRRVASWKGDSLFLKKVRSAHGDGAFKATRINDQWRYREHTGSVEDLCRYCLASPEAYLVQPAIEPHPIIRSFTGSQSLSTVRVITLLREGNCEILYSVLKLATAGQQTDNFDAGRSGNLLAAVDVESGRLSAPMGSKDLGFPSIVRFRENPYTGVEIEGCVLPFWSELKVMVRHAHATLPELPALGWDVAITKDGPIIVETNANFGTYLIEVALDKGVRSELTNHLRSFL